MADVEIGDEVTGKVVSIDGSFALIDVGDSTLCKMHISDAGLPPPETPPRAVRDRGGADYKRLQAEARRKAEAQLNQQLLPGTEVRAFVSKLPPQGRGEAGPGLIRCASPRASMFARDRKRLSQLKAGEVVPDAQVRFHNQRLGAFVDIGAVVRALLPLSSLPGWTRSSQFEHLEKNLPIDSKVAVVLKKVDAGKGQVTVALAEDA